MFFLNVKVYLMCIPFILTSLKIKIFVKEYLENIRCIPHIKTTIEMEPVTSNVHNQPTTRQSRQHSSPHLFLNFRIMT